MKKCLACNTVYPTSQSTCHACNLCYETIDGFPAYASSFAQDSSGFKSNYFADLAHLEDKNFWFRARNRLIIWALGYYCPSFHSFLEIGCGTGYVLSGIAKAYPTALLHGSEIFTQGLSFTVERLPSATLMQMDARHIPFIEEFDNIGAFDVLEHIKEDEQVLRQIHQALKPLGIVFLTVPQHKWLWSPVDDYACHIRRYSANEIHNKLGEADFKILRSTSFVTSLLPAMLISRFLQKLASKITVKPNAGIDISPSLNFIFEKMLNAEIHMIKT